MKIKKIINILLLLSFLLVLFGCNSDLEIIKNETTNSEQLVTVHKNFEFLKINKEIFKIICNSEKAKSSNENSKVVQTKDFKIYTDRVTYTTLKDKSRESYSFYIERNNSLKADDIIENLILSKNGTNDNYRAYIITYFFPDGIKSNNNKFKVDNFQEINAQTLSLKKIFAKTTCQDSYTFTIVETGHECYSGEHFGASEAGNCDGKGNLPYSTYSIQILTVSCDASGSGGGTYNPDSTSGTGTTGPINPNTGNTLPVDTGMTFPSPCQTDDCSEMLVVNEINDLLDKKLDYFQLEWLAMNHNTTSDIKSFLVLNNTTSNKEFVNEMINYCIANPLNSDSETTQLFFKALKSTNDFQNDLTESFVQENISDFSEDVQNQILIDPLLAVQIAQEYLIQRAVKKYLHPDLNEVEIYYSVLWDLRHMTLDAFGLIPVFGEVADLVNGVLYTIEGDKVNAAFSFASTVPLAGWATVTTKYAFKIVNASQTAVTIANRVKLTWKVVGNTVEFGSRSQLRKVLGVTASNLQAHHLIPWSSQTKMAVQKAAKYGSAFHMNEALNGIAVAAWRNQPNHQIYNDVINGKLDAFRNLNTNATPQECYEFLTDLINDIRTWIVNNPNSHLNDIVLP